MRARIPVGIALITVALGAFAWACDSGEERLLSRFAQPQPIDAVVAGRLRKGGELVDNAVVKVSASDAPGAAAPPIESVSVTNTGFFRFDEAPFRYDLHAITGRESTTFRGMGQRYSEPLLAGEASARGYVAHLVVDLEPRPAPDATVAFSVSGWPGVLGISGDLAHGLDVSFRTFQMSDVPPDGTCAAAVTLRAVVYAAGGSLADPSAYGRACVPRLVAGETATVSVHLDALSGDRERVLVQASPPPGVSAEPAEITVDFGLRFLAMPVMKVAVGTTATFLRIPDARYAVRVRARSGASLSDSGYTLFEPKDGVVKPVLPAPPTLSGPLDDAGALAFEISAESGVRELTLRPESGEAPVVRVVTMDRLVRIPDSSALGLAPLRGRYTASVRHWPKLTTVESLGGTEAREASPFADSQSVSLTR